MSPDGLSRRALLSGGLTRVRERLDREAPPPATDPQVRRGAAAQAFWDAGEDPRFADWCAPVAPALVEALDLPTLRAGVAPGEIPAPGAARAAGVPHVVDLGAGRGDLARIAAGQGPRVTAVDFAPGVVARGAAAVPDATWVGADVARLPLPDEAADAVVSAFGLIYAADMRAATDEARRILRPGGRLAIATWDSTGVMGALLRLARAADPHRFGRTRPERWGGYDGLLLALDRMASFELAPRELTWHAADGDALWAALTAPPGPLSRGEVAREAAEAALAPFLREAGDGVAVTAGWLLVTAEG